MTVPPGPRDHSFEAFARYLHAKDPETFGAWGDPNQTPIQHLIWGILGVTWNYWIEFEAAQLDVEPIQATSSGHPRNAYGSRRIRTREGLTL